jgi:uncharacterized protein YqjF (DUF2071 family)
MVPRRAIATIARRLYGEPYVTRPMRHEMAQTDSQLRLMYGWKRNGAWEKIDALVSGEPAKLKDGSPEEFITEHYWGYTAWKGRTWEYRVEHLRWHVWTAPQAKLEADAGTLWGKEFAAALSKPAASAFVAEGSRVVVKRGKKI